MDKFEKVIADVEVLNQRINHYRWLEDMRQEYESMIELIDHEKDYFTIRSFSYTARGDERTFNVNCHRSIPYNYIRDGLKAALKTILQEIDECKKDIEQSYSGIHN